MKVGNGTNVGVELGNRVLNRSYFGVESGHGRNVVRLTVGVRAVGRGCLHALHLDGPRFLTLPLRPVCGEPVSCHVWCASHFTPAVEPANSEREKPYSVGISIHCEKSSQLEASDDDDDDDNDSEDTIEDKL